MQRAQPIVYAEATPAPKSATFYDWQTPSGKRKLSKKKVALSHPILRDHTNTVRRAQHTPLSKTVAQENVARDARIGEAYAARKNELEQSSQLLDVTFEKPGPLGFKIILARGLASTRRRVVVDATFEDCVAFDTLRPNDEIIAVDGDLLIELDPEAFGELVSRLRYKRPLTLTFAMGDGRDKAMRDQRRKRDQESVKTTKAVVSAIQKFGLPRTATTTTAVVSDEEDDDDDSSSIVFPCFCVALKTLKIDDADYAAADTSASGKLQVQAPGLQTLDAL